MYKISYLEVLVLSLEIVGELLNVNRSSRNRAYLIHDGYEDLKELIIIKNILILIDLITLNILYEIAEKRKLKNSESRLISSETSKIENRLLSGCLIHIHQT